MECLFVTLNKVGLNEAIFHRHIMPASKPPSPHLPVVWVVVWVAVAGFRREYGQKVRAAGALTFFTPVTTH